MAFQLEIAFVGDIVDFESTTTGFACELFAVVGAEIGREYEGVRMIETQQVGEGAVHFVRDEEVVDAEGLFRECIGKWMVDNGDARAAVEENAGGEGRKCGAPCEGIATFDLPQGCDGQQDGRLVEGFPMVEGCGAQRGMGAERIGAEYVGAAVATK
mgnify:CR=1 FL=1